MTKPFINMIGLEEVKPEPREISYEELTSLFDGEVNLAGMANFAMYHFALVRSAVKEREKASGKKEFLTEVERKKLSFLYKIIRNLDRMGVSFVSSEHTENLAVLKSMHWLGEE